VTKSDRTPPLLFLVEDDASLASVTAEYLATHGFRVLVESRGDRAVEQILHVQPEVVILDIMLPGKDGLTVCREIRSGYKGSIIMLTALGEDMDQLVGLELGADDYICKPVKPRLLLARINAVLRRMQSRSHCGDLITQINFSDICINLSAREVYLDGGRLQLTTNEFDLLVLLASHAGQVLDRNFISLKIRGIEYDGLDRSIDLTISRLRRKLRDDPNHPQRIKTVRSQGYLFVG